jgi:hypothetical protein
MRTVTFQIVDRAAFRSAVLPRLRIGPDPVVAGCGSGSAARTVARMAHWHTGFRPVTAGDRAQPGCRPWVTSACQRRLGSSAQKRFHDERGVRRVGAPRSRVGSRRARSWTP